MDIIEKIKKIKKVNLNAMEEARKYQLSLAKPPRSLGVLEDISIRLAGITSNIFNHVDKRCLLVFASDNGVVCENVSSTPQSVTLKQTINLTKGLTGASVLAGEFNTDLFVYDVGVNADIKCDKVINKKIQYGTNNIARMPAMTKIDCLKAIEIGFEAVTSRYNDYDIFGIGEMGIGNTTTSSAILSVLKNTSPDLVTGKGAGLSDELYYHKIDIIKQAIDVNKPNPNDIIDVLSKIGGFDICAMTGAYLGCAYHQKPVVVDGFISIVAALCASRLNNNAKDYFFLSHESFEVGYVLAKEELGLEPLFNLKMRLGEGSGCPLAFEIIKGACAIINKMATFDAANIDDDYIEDIVGEENFIIKRR